MQEEVRKKATFFLLLLVSRENLDTFSLYRVYLHYIDVSELTLMFNV